MKKYILLFVFTIFDLQAKQLIINNSTPFNVTISNKRLSFPFKAPINVLSFTTGQKVNIDVVPNAPIYISDQRSQNNPEEVYVKNDTTDIWIGDRGDRIEVFQTTEKRY